MGVEKPLSYRLSAAPDAEGFVAIYTVKPGQRYRAKRIRVHFPSGTAGELRVALYYGAMKVAPETDYYSGDDFTYENGIDVTYFSGDPVRIWYKNTSTTAYRYADIEIAGCLD